MLSGILGLGFGLVAVLVAMRVRRDLSARLGSAWRVRFLLVQGVLINLALFFVWRWVAANLGWGEGTAVWIVSLAYAPTFFVYSLSNIDWTARKFHCEVEAAADAGVGT